MQRVFIYGFLVLLFSSAFVCFARDLRAYFVGLLKSCHHTICCVFLLSRKTHCCHIGILYIGITLESSFYLSYFAAARSCVTKHSSPNLMRRIIVFRYEKGHTLIMAWSRPHMKVKEKTMGMPRDVMTEELEDVGDAFKMTMRSHMR